MRIPFCFFRVEKLTQCGIYVVYANSFLAAYVSLNPVFRETSFTTLSSPFRMNTRKVLRGRGTDAENTTMPTFLMVGKVTRHESHVDGGDISMVRLSSRNPYAGTIEPQ